MRKPKRKWLTAQQLRSLLLEQQAAEREERLSYFRQTGRISSDYQGIEPRLPQAAVSGIRSSSLPKKLTSRINVLDGFLLFVEFGALIALIFIIINGVNVLSDLNLQVLKVLQPPTQVPTPWLSAIVLPSGHTPPDASGKAHPNDDEIPRHLLPMVQSFKNIPIPTPSIEQTQRIKIPAIHVDAPVLQGDDWEQLKKGVGQRIGTPNPAQAGNIVLSAHNDIFGEIFRDLDKLKPGDEVILFTSQKEYTYYVTNIKITEPTDVAVMDATIDPTLTLISCYPYLVDNQRIVVSAKFQKDN